MQIQISTGPPSKERELDPVHAFWSYGFRPFFAFGTLYAALIIPLWLVVLSGGMPPPGPLPATLWHAHELLYGFVMAIAAGFLLTAVPNWTKAPPTRGLPLIALVSLWIAGRVVMLSGSLLSGWMVALIDLAFLPILAIVLARPILKSEQRRNYGFPVLLLTMVGCNAWMHAQGLGWVQSGSSQAVRMALLVMVVMIVVIGGRVTPQFTKNALFKQVTIRERDRRDDVAVYSTTAAMAAAVLPLPAVLQGVLGIVAGLAVAYRMVGWDSFRTRHSPLLWILHVGYAWVALGLVLHGLSMLIPAFIPETAALHALTTGAMGTYIMGMVSRVSLGHTGRKLELAPVMVVAYALVLVAGVLRAFGPLLLPGAGLPLLHSAGSAWALAYLIFLWKYLPILWKPRF